jgi:hypothetical protein
MASLRADLINKYWVSTAYRETEIQGMDIGYFETIVWEYDWVKNKQKIGKIVGVYPHGSTVKSALKEHYRLVKIFSYLHCRKNRESK